MILGFTIPKKIRRLVVGACGLLLILLIGWFGHNVSQTGAANETSSRLKEELVLFQNYLESELDRVNLVVDILSQNPNLIEALLDPSNPKNIDASNDILETSNIKLKTSALFLMDTNGLTVSSSNHNEEISFIGNNYAFRPYFIQALEEKKGQFLAIGITSKKLGYYISRAVYQDKALLGVIVVKVDLEHLRSFSKDLNGDFLLIDEKGIIFLSSNKKLELKSLDLLTAENSRRILQTKQYPIDQIEKLNIAPPSVKFGKNQAVSINKKNYLHEKIDFPEFKWSVWMLGDVNTITNRALTNGFAFSTFAFFCLVALYLVFKRKQDLDQFQTIVDYLPSGVTLFSHDLSMLMCNDRVKEILDFPDHLFKNGLPNMRTLIKFNAERGEYGPGDPNELAKEALKKINLQQDHIFERVRPDGTVLEVRGLWLADKGFVTTYTDITDRKKAEEEAKRNAGYLQALLHNLDQGVTVTDENLNIVFWNKAFFRLLDLPDHLQKPVMKYEDLIRYNADRGEYGPGDSEQHVQMRVQAALKFEPHHFERNRPDGNTLEVTGKPLVVDGKSYGFISTYVDITEHKRMAERLQKLANTDALTDLANRRHFNALLTSEIKRCQRNGQPLSLLFLDLDYFKDINDKHGHAFGDTALKEFARVCKDILRDIDVIGRMGGEEFAVFLPETDRNGAKILAERLRKATEDIVLKNDKGEPVHLSVSIGISLFESAMDDTMDDLMVRADKALYKAKNQGRNRVC